MVLTFYFLLTEGNLALLFSNSTPSLSTAYGYFFDNTIEVDKPDRILSSMQKTKSITLKS